MTPRQRDALDFIQTYFASNRCMPTLAEISEGIGQSSRSGAHRLVQGLINRGDLLKTKGSWRSIALPVDALGTISTADLVAELKRREVSHG
jgi:SOS-response transcriptional repressor LexA